MSVELVIKVVNVLHNIFFRVSLINPIRRSQNPPNKGGRLGMNFQSIFCLSLSSVELNICFSSSAAAKPVEELSDIMVLGVDFQPLKANRKVSTLRSVTTSKCTALVIAQVNRHTYTFISSSGPFTDSLLIGVMHLHILQLPHTHCVAFPEVAGTHSCIYMHMHTVS